MANTNIEWADKVWNCVRGCARVSPGCQHCYAERFAARGLPGLNSPTTDEPFAIMMPSGPRWTGKVELIESKLAEPLKWRKPCRVFVNSMSDIFHEGLSDSDIDRIFAVMAHARARGHVFQALTKRSDRMESYFLRPNLYEQWLDALDVIRSRWSGLEITGLSNPANIPLGNVWLGVSVESCDYLHRIDALRRTPVALRFLSLEPLLEDLGTLDLTGISWVIVGGESGPGARPMHPDWARSIRDQCLAAGVPYFFKQQGAWQFGSDLKGRATDRILLNDGTLLKPDAEDATQKQRNNWATFAPTMVSCVGKKAAGALLDGREWREMPR